MKMIIKDVNGDIREVEVTENMDINVEQGEQFFFTGAASSEIAVFGDNKDVKLNLVDENGETISIGMIGLAEHINANDPSDSFSLTTALGVSTTREGDAEIAEIVNDPELEVGNMIEQLKEALSKSNSGADNDGVVIDDFASLIELSESSAVNAEQLTTDQFNSIENSRDENKASNQRASRSDEVDEEDEEDEDESKIIYNDEIKEDVEVIKEEKVVESTPEIVEEEIVEIEPTPVDTPEVEEDIIADSLSATISVGESTNVTQEIEIVDENANELAGIVQRDGLYYQEVDTNVIDADELKEMGYTLDSDGKIYLIDDDAPKVLVEQDVEKEVTKVVDAEPIMKEVSETTSYETLGEAHIDDGSIVATKSSENYSFEETTSNIELDFGNFDTGTAKISFYDENGDQVGDTVNQSPINGAAGYPVPAGAVGMTVYNNTNSDDFEVESISYRGEPETVTVEAGGLVPDYEAMEAAGIIWTETSDAVQVQTADITNIGNVGNSKVDGFNPEDHETSQVFDFGPELANRLVSITVDMEVKGTWDNNATSTNDYFSVSANGQEIDVNNYSNKSSGHNSDDVEVMHKNGTDFTYTYEVYLDSNGQVELDFMVASTASSEIVNVENIEVSYEGQTGWVQEVTETVTFVESVLVDAAGSEISSDDVVGGIPMITEEIIVDSLMTTEDEVIGRTFSVDIAAALTDTDGSETLSVIIANVPEGGILSEGVQNFSDDGSPDGTWTIEVPEDATSITDSLTITVPAGIDSLDLEIAATSTETSTGDTSSVVSTQNSELDISGELSEDGSSFLLDEDSIHIDFDSIHINNELGLDVIDMSNGDHTLSNIDLQDIIDMTDDDNDLVFIGNDGDVIDFGESEEWTKSETTTTVDGVDGEFTEYESTTNSHVTVFIQEEIEVISTDF